MSEGLLGLSPSQHIKVTIKFIIFGLALCDCEEVGGGRRSSIIGYLNEPTWKKKDHNDGKALIGKEAPPFTLSRREVCSVICVVWTMFLLYLCSDMITEWSCFLSLTLMVTQWLPDTVVL